MTGLDRARLLAAAILLVPALACGSMALVGWRNALRQRTGSLVLWVVTGALTMVTGYFVAAAVQTLFPGGGQPSDARLVAAVLGDVCLIGASALVWHVVPLSVLHGPVPGRAALVVAYGTAAAVAVLAAVPALVPVATPTGRWLVTRGAVLLYLVVMSALGVQQMRRVVRQGRWGLGGLGEVRGADALWGAASVVPMLGMVLLVWSAERHGGMSVAAALVVALLGLVQTVPYAVRFMAEGARVFITTLALGGVTVATYVGAHGLTPGGGIERDLATLLGLFLVLVPGQALVRRAVDRFFFRRSRRQHEELQAILRQLSPELGVLECCRRVLPEAVRIIQLRGAAMLLRDGETVVCGDFDAAALCHVWPRGDASDALPRRPFGGPEFRFLPPAVVDAVTAAQVTGVLPIVSPRRRWGDMFATAGLMTAIYSREDVQVWEAFAAQYALVLDAAELVTRAVAVERSLAHAEKLAAIGELTARVVHEIRNPVAAARSLAHQLCREPGAPFQAEHEVILGELERVERQVAELLRFARREEFRFAPVDLGRLARATLEGLRPRLEAAGVQVACEVPEAVTVQADAEKLRQVLINLIENALDALANTDGIRQLAVAVAGVDGQATIRVSDSGPGAPADVLPHLFEPFYSTKASGTGLGLAIVQRTVEAHGGRIVVHTPAAGGMMFEIALPVVHSAGGEAAR